MAAFIGRKQELAALEGLYKADGFQMVVMYGRRRVGKSTLLEKFISGKKAVFYTAVRMSLQKNVELFGKQVLAVLAPGMQSLSFVTMDGVFDFLEAHCGQERIIVVIDEFPYLAESDRGILSVLQKYIDTRWLKGNMYLVLCGSSVSFMENEVLSEKSPLFGRRTAQIHLDAFDYREAAEFVPSYTYEEKAICYGITGGIAKYLSLLDDKETLDENIARLFFSKSGYMYEEPGNLLTQEFRNVSSYSAIIEAVASGANKVNDIADKAHLDATTVSHALANLMATSIVQKDFAVTEEDNKKKVQYALKDTMFRFWYRFVPDGIAVIELGRGGLFYQKAVRPFLSEYMGHVFEDICRQYTLCAGTDGRLPCFVTSVGRWWGTNPVTREQTDIDVVALAKMERKAVLGECKFKNEAVDKKVMEDLLARNGLIDRSYQTAGYLLFSKAGFSPWVREHCAENGVMLVDMEELYA